MNPQQIHENWRKQSNAVLLIDFFKYFAHLLPQTKQQKQSAMVALRDAYRDQQEKLKLIDDIEENYRQEDSIIWYSKRNFFNQLLNEPIRAEDLDRLLLLRSFFIDLTSTLQTDFEKMSSSYQKYSVNFYRATKLSTETLKDIEKCQGQIIKIHGYFLASKDVEKAQRYLKEDNEWIGSVNVLFEIQCNPIDSGPRIRFLDLSSYNDSSVDHEILFDLNPSFMINSVEEKNSFFVVRLSTSDQLKTINQVFLYHMDPHVHDQSISILFGRFLCDLKRYDESRKHFELLLNDPAEDLASVSYNMGRTFHRQAEWRSAQIYYNQVLRSIQSDCKDRIKDLVRVLNAIGHTYFMEKDYVTAEKHYREAFKLLNERNMLGHHLEVGAFIGIGSILVYECKYQEAFQYFRDAVTVCQANYQYGHIRTASSHLNLAKILYIQEKYTDALEQYRQASIMYERFYPEGHVKIIECLSPMAKILHRQGKLYDAMERYQKEIQLRDKLNLSEDIQSAAALEAVGNIYFDQEKYPSARECYEKVLLLRMNAYPSGHIDVAVSHMCLGNTCLKEGSRNEALRHYNLALNMFNEFHSEPHADTASSFIGIGDVKYLDKNYSEAFSSYQDALTILELLDVQRNIEIVYLLNKIGNCLENVQNKLEARQVFKRASAICKNCNIDSDHPALLLTNENLLRLKSPWNKFYSLIKRK